MKYSEKICDLFTVPENYYLAHCISADFVMGAGIAVEFNKRFNMKNLLKNSYPDFVGTWDNDTKGGTCIMAGRVFNLVTKRDVWRKPTYEDMRMALNAMKSLAMRHNVTHIAMPLIGCGIDGLQWEKVSTIVKDVFGDTDIEILVCKRF